MSYAAHVPSLAVSTVWDATSSLVERVNLPSYIKFSLLLIAAAYAVLLMAFIFPENCRLVAG